VLDWPIVLAVFLLSGTGVWLRRGRRQQRVRSWLAAIERCGLTDVGPLPSVGPLQMTAAGPGLKVRFAEYSFYSSPSGAPLSRWLSSSSWYTTARRQSGTRVVLECPREDFGVRLRLETRVSAYEKRASSGEIEVGDPSFDDVFYVGGAPARVFAALDGPTRRQLLTLAEQGRGVQITGTALTFDIDEDCGGGPASVSHFVAQQIALAQRLIDRTDVPRRLARNALDDALGEVRLNNLLTLAREFPNDPATLKALRTACSDSVPEVRRRAALALGDDGRPVLRALLESEVDDLCMARCVSALAAELSGERIRSILDRALRGRCVETARTCLGLLGRSGDSGAVATLAKVLAIERHGELGVAAAHALGATRYTDAEPPLLEALRYESAEVRIAGATALGQVGSVASVIPLKDCARSDHRDRELERAVRQAIAEIQSRVTGASPGQVSLTGSETGRLSISESEAGQLSIPEGTSGRVSRGDSRDET